MPQLAVVIEHRYLEPAVIGTKTRRPDNGADLAAAQIDRQALRRWRARWLKPLYGAALEVGTAAAMPRVEGIEQAVHLQICQGQLVGEASRKECTAVAYQAQTTDQLDAGNPQCVQIERRALWCANQLWRG